MDAIDNLVFSTLNLCLYTNNFQSHPIKSDFNDINLQQKALNIPGFDATLPGVFNTQTKISSYTEDARLNFVTLDDPGVIADAIRKHWFDVTERISYTNTRACGGRIDPTGGSIPMFDPSNTNSLPPDQINPTRGGAFVKFNIPPYHLIFPYLVENTRIAQIFERLITMYIQDEKLTKANDKKAFQWIMNTESLFYSTAKLQDRRNLNSFLRPVSEATRRNAYHRMFGMELAFGDQNNNAFAYPKAEFNNSSFITLFENFLIEAWRGYTNANNTSGQNTTDTEHLEEIARRLQELLMSRRTTELNFNNYRYFNLSLEEYASNIFMYWLFYIISYDSPVVNYLNCTANTPGDRLINIGRKVGLPAHTKSVALFDIAQPMNTVLRSMEVGIFNDSVYIQKVLKSQSINAGTPAPQEVAMLNDLLLIINNWEKATGHRIKNPEANITGSVSIRPNGVRMPAAAN